MQGAFREQGVVAFDWAAWSDVGKRRDVNEDELHVSPGLFVVADGMGGHGGGQIASQAAIAALADRVGPPIELDDVSVLMSGARDAVVAAAERASQQQMGTTLVAAIWATWADRHGLVIANVGDSRCYEMGPGGLRLVTRDHSVVQELLDAGQLTEQQARSHPDRHVVTQAFGGGSAGVVEFIVLDPIMPQRLLLCSDGVSGQVSDTDLAACLDFDHSPAEAVQLLADLVLGGDAPDNATAVVVEVGWDATVVDASGDVASTTVPRSDATSVATAERRLLERWATPHAERSVAGRSVP